MKFIRALEELSGILETQRLSFVGDDLEFEHAVCEWLEQRTLQDLYRRDDVINWVAACPASEDPMDEAPAPLECVFHAGKACTIALRLHRGEPDPISSLASPGVFQVMEGRFTFTRFGFDPSAGDDVEIRPGALTVRTSDVLSAGDVRPTMRGPEGIHQWIPLTTPSVLLSVHAVPDSDALPRYYLESGLSFSKRQPTEEDRKILEMIALFRETQDPRLDEFVEAAVVQAKDRCALEYLLAFSAQGDRDRFEGVLNRVSARSPRPWLDRLRGSRASLQAARS